MSDALGVTKRFQKVAVEQGILLKMRKNIRNENF